MKRGRTEYDERNVKRRRRDDPSPPRQSLDSIQLRPGRPQEGILVERSDRRYLAHFEYDPIFQAGRLIIQLWIDLLKRDFLYDVTKPKLEYTEDQVKIYNDMLLEDDAFKYFTNMEHEIGRTNAAEVNKILKQFYQICASTISACCVARRYTCLLGTLPHDPPALRGHFGTPGFYRRGFIERARPPHTNLDSVCGTISRPPETIYWDG